MLFILYALNAAYGAYGNISTMYIVHQVSAPKREKKINKTANIQLQKRDEGNNKS